MPCGRSCSGGRERDADPRRCLPSLGSARGSRCVVGVRRSSRERVVYLFLVTALVLLLVVVAVLLFRELGVLGGLVVRLLLLLVPFFRLLRVHGLADLHRGLVQGLLLGGDRFQILPFLDLLGLGDGLLHLRLGLIVELVGVVLDGLLRRVDQAVDVVLLLDQLPALGVVLGVRLGVADHLLDVVLRQTAAGLDDDVLLLSGALVLRADVEDPVRVDVEGNLDLGDPAGGRRDADKIELPERLVVGGHLALSLHDLDLDLRLVVRGRREGLLLLGGDGRVSRDELRHDASQRLDSERQRRHVQQQDVLDVTLEDPALDGGSHRHDLVGVDTAAGRLAEELLDGLLDLGHPGHSPNEDDLVDVGLVDVGVLDAGLAGIDRSVDQGLDHVLELRPGDLGVHVLRSRRVGRDEGERDVRLGQSVELALGLLGGFSKALHGEVVALQVDAGILLELAQQMGQQLLVEVLSAQHGVSVGGLDLEHAALDLEDAHIEGSSPEIEDDDRLAVRLVHPVRQGGGRRLVDDAQHFEAGDLTGVLGGLALAVVEVGRDGDDGLADGPPQESLGGFLHLGQDHGPDLAGRVLGSLGVGHPGVVVVIRFDDLVGDQSLDGVDLLVVEAPPDESLDGVHGVFRVGHGLSLGGHPHEALRLFAVAVRERHDGGGGPRTLRVLNDTGRASLHDGNARVRGTEIDSDHVTGVVGLESTGYSVEGGNRRRGFSRRRSRRREGGGASSQKCGREHLLCVVCASFLLI
mmetsp:Transcript_23293/g.55089  ORF Transcript_23293/g.55089 Transcript_23293/m.55089 type:complete len:749 (+) Transcript_23293:55-2301(+)